jgi:hypothetical protein
MGSFNSKAKPVVAQYASAPQPTPQASAPMPEAPAENAEAPRRRNASQTILTSFRGVLSPGDWVPARKSLLGE